MIIHNGRKRHSYLFRKAFEISSNFFHVMIISTLGKKMRELGFLENRCGKGKGGLIISKNRNTELIPRCFSNFQHVKPNFDLRKKF